jgi:hypothetical protein
VPALDQRAARQIDQDWVAHPTTFSRIERQGAWALSPLPVEKTTITPSRSTRGVVARGKPLARAGCSRATETPSIGDGAQRYRQEVLLPGST